ncbi:MAG: DUF423 domain-containing protein [Verrucomicrobiia bacterium]
MNNVLALRIAAVAGMLAVALGAFGAHALSDTLARNGTSEIWQTAVFYHFIHALALTFLTVRQRLVIGPWTCFLVGIAVFSGSLYVLALTNQRWLGAITPIGGVSFIAGWIWMAIAAPRLVRSV